jgi:hypothetical protein
VPMSATGFELSSVGALTLMFCEALTADSGFQAMPGIYDCIPYQMTLVCRRNLPLMSEYRSRDRAVYVRRECLVPVLPPLAESGRSR